MTDDPGFTLRALWALRDDRTLQGSDWKVAVALLSFADEHGCCWPGIAKLAAVARTSRTAVRRSLARLEVNAGPLSLSVERGRVSRNGDPDSHQYILSLKGWAQAYPTRDQLNPTRDQTPQGVGPGAPGGGTTETPGGGTRRDPEEDTKKKTRKTTVKRARAARWTRFPADFEPTDEHRAIAREEGVDFDRQLKLIRDHEFKTPRSDADAALRTWLRSPYAKQPAKTPVQQGGEIRQGNPWWDQQAPLDCKTANAVSK